MKVVIIDDHSYAIRGMMIVAKWAGHEVVGVCLIDPDVREYIVKDSEYPGQLLTSNFNEAVQAVRDFNPDVIFIDHEFRYTPGITGDKLAVMIGYSPAMLVGTGDAAQEYCARQMQCSKMGIGEVASDGEEFLELILTTKK